MKKLHTAELNNSKSYQRNHDHIKGNKKRGQKKGRKREDELVIIIQKGGKNFKWLNQCMRKQRNKGRKQITNQQDNNSQILEQLKNRKVK